MPTFQPRPKVTTRSLRLFEHEGPLVLTIPCHSPAAPRRSSTTSRVCPRVWLRLRAAPERAVRRPGLRGETGRLRLLHMPWPQGLAAVQAPGGTPQAPRAGANLNHSPAGPPPGPAL
jgi:hypothetical protein